MVVDQEPVLVAVDLDNGSEITILKIAEAFQRALGDLLRNVSISELHVFSGHNNFLFLNKEEIWNAAQHGDDTKGNALIVKYIKPLAGNNQASSDGAYCFSCL
jgi:hypothetical protein